MIKKLSAILYCSLSILVLHSVAKADDGLSGPMEIPLYDGVAPGSEGWSIPEIKASRSLSNVSRPRLLAFTPKKGQENGTAVIIAPGGAMVGLAIDLEGYQVARWLTDRGFVAFVLVYRTMQIPPTELATIHEKLGSLGGSPESPLNMHVPLAIGDGVRAVQKVRTLTGDYGFMPDRIAIVGFSAGGRVAIGASTNPVVGDRPDYAGWIYTGVYENPESQPIEFPDDLPPVFLACAADDSIFKDKQFELFEALTASGNSVELHMFNKGRHGFGMRKQGTTSDHWIDEFAWWLESYGLTRNP